MKTFPVDTLEAEYYFTKPVYLDENYILLTPETQLSKQLIDRLKRWSYEAVLSDGDLVAKPIANASGDAGETVALSVDQDVRENTLFREAQEFMKRC
jgi:hypothetical protein